MIRYENKLATFLVSSPLEQKKGYAVKLRAFSHVAKHPREVKKWIAVNLKEFGDTVLFDQRTCELLNGHDPTFIITRKKQITLLNAVEIDGEFRQNAPERAKTKPPR